MRIIVLLHPTNKHGTKMEFTELRKFLLRDGYIMLQSEVFMRVTDTRKSCIKYQNRIQVYLPSTGVVRMLILIENQFKDCVLFQEGTDYQEKKVGAKDLVVL